MDYGAALGGGGGRTETAGNTGIGGGGRGASGAATIFGDKTRGGESSPILILVGALAAVMLVGLLVFLITKK